VDIGALVWANAGKYDFYVLAESNGGKSQREIRDRLWDVIFEEMEARRVERQVEYIVPEPAYAALREGRWRLVCKPIA